MKLGLSDGVSLFDLRGALPTITLRKKMLSGLTQRHIPETGEILDT